MKKYLIKISLFSVGLAVLMSCNQSPKQAEETNHSQNKTEEKMEQKQF